jgi:protein-disulfide isomerase
LTSAVLGNSWRAPPLFLELVISKGTPRGRALRFAAFALSLAAVPLIAWFALPTAAAAAEITKADFFKPGIAPVHSKGAYDITIVYFMDYQCPVCRAHTNDYARVFSEEPKVRVIYRDTPIFGAQSEVAARLAIASQFQGKHAAFHLALMRSKGRLTDAVIREAAAKAGVNWARLQKDLAARKAQIDAQIAINMRLSKAAGISGTPAFIVGDTLADGAFDYANLKGQIADVRAAARKGR